MTTLCEQPIETETEVVGTHYPCSFPSEAIETILRIGRSRSFFRERTSLIFALWQIEGFVFGALIGNPDGSSVESVPSGLQSKLLAVRDVLHKGIGDLRGMTTTGPLSGDICADPSLPVTCNTLAAIFQAGLTNLAYLRKLAMTTTK